MKTARPEDRGFTLLELIAVLAIFSLVAIMSVNALAGGLRGTMRIAQTSDQLTNVMTVTEVLRRDLEAIVPVSSSFATGGPPASFVVEDTRHSLSFVTMGQLDRSTLQGGTLMSVRWDVNQNSNTLIRTERPHASGAPARSTLALDGVSGWNVSIWTDRGERRPGPAWRRQPPETLPRGIEVSFAVETLGPLQVVVAR